MFKQTEATAIAAETPKRNIFIGYCQNDIDWLEKIQTFINTLPDHFNARPWSDQEIKTGGDWKPAILHAMQSAQIAILLISADFLASPFIRDIKIPSQWN